MLGISAVLDLDAVSGLDAVIGLSAASGVHCTHHLLEIVLSWIAEWRYGAVLISPHPSSHHSDTITTMKDVSSMIGNGGGGDRKGSHLLPHVQ